MKFILFEDMDITDSVLTVTNESALHSDLEKTLSSQQEFLLSNKDGKFSASFPTGVFYAGGYRNQLIQILDDNNQVIYKGQILQLVEEISANFERLVRLITRGIMGSFLQMIINDAEIAEDYKVHGNQNLGATTIPVKDGVSAVTIPSVVAASNILHPSYLITQASGDPATSLNLERGLEAPLANNTILYISKPVQRTIPAAIRSALLVPLTLFNQAGRLGNSFEELHQRESSWDRKIDLFIRHEDEVELSKHLSKLLNAGDFYLREEQNGQLELIDGLAYDGSEIEETISEAEIIGPISIEDDSSRLLYGFDLPYKTSGLQTALATYNLAEGWVDGREPQFEPGLDGAKLADSLAMKNWAPLPIKSSINTGNHYLFNNQITAEYYGLKKLRYFSSMRKQIKCGIKPFYSGNPNQPLVLTLFKRFILNLRISETESFINEPICVLGFEKEKTTGEYKSVILELNNSPTPGIAL